MNITVKPPERLDDDDDEGEIVMISEWQNDFSIDIQCILLYFD